MALKRRKTKTTQEELSNKLKSKYGSKVKLKDERAMLVTAKVEKGIKMEPFEVAELKSKVVTSYSKIAVLMSNVSFDWNDDSRGYKLVNVIRDGIDYKTFVKVTKEIPLVDSDWAEVLGTTTRTLNRYKKDNRIFASKQTETIIEVKQLLNYGKQVFGEIENFHKWLMVENVALGGVVPKDLLDTSVGLGMVRDELGRIEHGIFA